jgi:TolA-binding protein
MIHRRPPFLPLALLTIYALAGSLVRAQEEAATEKTETHADPAAHGAPAEHGGPETHGAPEKPGAHATHAAAETTGPKPAQPAPAEHKPEKPANVAHGEAAKTGKAVVEKRSAPPGEIRGLLNFGASLTERGEYESAEIAFRQVLTFPEASDPETQTALLGLARMHRRQGALTKAVAVYEKFLKEYPGSDRAPDALLDLGRTHRAMGAHKLAIARFYNVINSTLKMPSEGFERYQQLAKTAQFEIAETHFQAGQFSEAAKYFALLRLLDLAPADRANATFKAGYSLELQGENEKAVTTLRSYIEQFPEDENLPQARYLLATTLRKLNRQQEALAATLELLREAKSRSAIDPKRWTYWQRRTGNQLANDFFESGETLNAQAIYQGMLTLSDEPGWRLPISYQIALCQERLGHSDQAKETFQQIVDAAGANPPAEVAEVTRMATWRISHLDWREKTGVQLTSFFETTTGRAPPPPPLLTSETP